MHHVRLFLNMSEVLCLGSFVFQAFFMRVEHEVVFAYTPGDVLFPREIDCLWDVADVANGNTGSEPSGQFHNGLFAHAIDEQVGTCITKDTFLEFVLPIVVVGDASQRGLYTA